MRPPRGRSPAAFSLPRGCFGGTGASSRPSVACGAALGPCRAVPGRAALPGAEGFGTGPAAGGQPRGVAGWKRAATPGHGEGSASRGALRRAPLGGTAGDGVGGSAVVGG